VQFRIVVSVSAVVLTLEPISAKGVLIVVR
jgi:hypothetical protein